MDKIIIEGELIRHWYEYESDDLFIGDTDVMRHIIDILGPGIEQVVGTIPGYQDTETKTFFGPVRLTIEKI